MRYARWAAGLAAVLIMAGCGSAAPASHPAAAPAGTTAPAGTAAHRASTPESGASPGVHGPGVHAARRPPKPAVITSRFRAGDGSVVTLARFDGPVRFRLHCGSRDPGAAALSVVRAGPRVGHRERHRLLAAFNGGFLLSAGAGGYEQEGHIISPLRRGAASLVIDRSGAARIGTWGAGLPRPREAVFSVRQNLRPLVRRGHATRAAADWTLWGATLGGGESVAHSALGENAAGQLIYAAGMSTTPADLAAALVHAGARAAMELDINPEWVQLDIARGAGRRLHAAIPGQVRPAGQYFTGWTRDFVTVLAR